jgi:hypothetical protein
VREPANVKSKKVQPKTRKRKRIEQLILKIRTDWPILKIYFWNALVFRMENGVFG